VNELVLLDMLINHKWRLLNLHNLLIISHLTSLLTYWLVACWNRADVYRWANGQNGVGPVYEVQQHGDLRNWHSTVARLGKWRLLWSLIGRRMPVMKASVWMTSAWRKDRVQEEVSSYTFLIPAFHLLLYLTIIRKVVFFIV